MITNHQISSIKNVGRRCRSTVPLIFCLLVWSVSPGFGHQIHPYPADQIHPDPQFHAEAYYPDEIIVCADCPAPPADDIRSRNLTNEALTKRIRFTISNEDALHAEVGVIQVEYEIDIALARPPFFTQAGNAKADGGSRLVYRPYGLAFVNITRTMNGKTEKFAVPQEKLAIIIHPDLLNIETHIDHSPTRSASTINDTAITHYPDLQITTPFASTKFRRDCNAIYDHYFSAGYRHKNLNQYFAIYWDHDEAPKFRTLASGLCQGREAETILKQLNRATE